MRPSVSFLSVPLACFACLVLSGCSLSSTARPAPDAGLAIQGRVQGGNQPITGAHIYLFAANHSGYAGVGIVASSANKSISLLTTGSTDSVGTYVTTDSNGNFTITGDYSCTPNQQVYIYALGGNPGLAAGTNNTASGLLAVLGNCPSAGNFLAATPFIDVDEVTTIAAAYAFAGYATDATHVSSSGSALAQVGIANAFAAAVNLAGISSGAALATTPAGNGTVPQAEIDTLADILAACVNTDGTTSACSTLFADARAGGTIGALPNDTATAAINIAHNPSANIAALYGMASASPPFAGLATQPNDFTVAINYTGAGVSDPYGLAIDASGNVWVTDIYTNSVSELYAGNVNGAYYTWSSNSPIIGLEYPEAIAIDGLGNAWVANSTGNSVSEFTSSGSAAPGSPFTGDGLYRPRNIAIHPSGYVLVADTPNLSGQGGVSAFNLVGAAAGFATGGGTIAGPFGIAVDVAGHMWTTNPGEYTLSELSSTGSAMSPASGWGNANEMSAPNNFAIDASGNLWIADGSLMISALSEYTPSATPPAMGTFSAASPITGGGLGWPWGVAIDGAGNVWASNYYNGWAAISELNPGTGAWVTPATGYITKSGGSAPTGIAIDGSGNVWVACQGVYSYSNGTLTEYVGAAAPVVTPMVANLMSPYGSAAVNKP